MDTVRETSTLIAASKVKGTDVFNTGGDRVGSIYDLMIDKETGQVAYAIMSFGGFLGIWDSYQAERARRRAVLRGRGRAVLGRSRL